MCTMQEREKRVLEALAINSLDGTDLSERCMKLLQSYIEGKSTIEENIEGIKNYYLNQKEDKPVQAYPLFDYRPIIISFYLIASEIK